MGNRYRETFDQVRASERLRKEVLEMAKKEQAVPPKRRIPKAALIAAVLVVALTGTALAAVGMPGTLRDWFTWTWQERTDSDISQEHLALIDSLTQEVGVSDTCGDVTVTVDSITVGGSQIWALLDVEGLEFDGNARYSFDRMRVDIVPDPSEGQFGGAAYGLGSIGIMEDGRCRMLLEFSATISTGNQLDSGDYTLEIDLNDVIRCHIGGVEDEILYEGDWSFSILLTPESLSPAITIDSVQVPSNQMVWDQTGDEKFGSSEGAEPRPAVAMLTNLQITATGVSFYCDGLMDRTRATAILADGTEVEDHGGGGSRTEDGGWYVSFDWPVPLDVRDIVALRFGSTEIPLA